MEENKFRRKSERTNKIIEIIISFGGFAIIASIVAIFLFLLFKTLPLMTNASVEEMLSLNIGKSNSIILTAGTDQYKEVLYSINNSGKIDFININDSTTLLCENLELLPNEKIVVSAKGNFHKEIFALGTDSGRVIILNVKLSPEFEGNNRKIVPSFSIKSSFLIDSTDSADSFPIRLAYSSVEDGNEVVSYLTNENRLFVHIFDSENEVDYTYDLTEKINSAETTSITMSENGENLIIGDNKGELFWFNLKDAENIFLEHNWKASKSTITALSFLIGDNSLIVGNYDGEVNGWFPIRNKMNELRFNLVHQFEKHSSPVNGLVISPRDRTFISTDISGQKHINYSTTNELVGKFSGWQNQIIAASYSPKADGITFVDENNKILLYNIDNPHPEASLQTLFGTVWYEGYSEPEFVWQSTGGSDEFEPKLSLIPLIFGTFKGTLYALLFSIPLALLGAVYISQFAPVKLAQVVKPTIEIMAALPSVVIGFLAGLYFSPLFEEHLVTIFISMITLPILLFIFIISWSFIPEEKRLSFPQGRELIFILPVIVFTFFLAVLLSEPIEFGFFNGNLKQWLFDNFEINYDQRNSLVVGFALGFAVVPIIFTIAEDALSNVPKSLTSAALALGATKWQSVMRIVIPAAAGGIFAAIMLGLGRAIGETMIVLMATGNTPIIDLSPFNGFRAMSACIAVEIPEAPVDGTLYRILFLTAFLLFIFTFFINTFAGFIGDKLRKKYARF